MAVQASLDLKDPHQELRRQLASLVARGHSVASLAAMIGKPRPTISRFMNEPGFGSKDLAEAITALVERMQSAPVVSAVRVAADGFVFTRDAEEILGVCELAQESRKLAVIVGPAGAGKTSALNRYKANVPDAVMVRANPNMSAAGLCIRIGQQLGLGLRNGQSLDYMVDAIVQDLSNRPRLVMVDEADYLITATSLRKMEILRTIFDEGGVGMVICGMTRLMHHLTVGTSMKENLAQFYSRVAYLRRLVGFSEEEIRVFCRQFPVEDSAVELLCRLARNPDRGGLRRLSNLLSNSSLLASGEAITYRHVEVAARELELIKQ